MKEKIKKKNKEKRGENLYLEKIEEIKSNQILSTSTHSWDKRKDLRRKKRGFNRVRLRWEMKKKSFVLPLNEKIARKLIIFPFKITSVLKNLLFFSSSSSFFCSKKKLISILITFLHLSNLIFTFDV